MPRWFPVKYTNGERIIAKSPSLWQSPYIRQYHLALLKEWQDLIAWPTEREIEIRMYDEFEQIYKAIASLLVPIIDCDRLTSSDRFEFFICTEPVEHPRMGVIAGLSRLSYLMGYEISDEVHELPEHTTGDSELDLYADLQVVFKSRAKQIAQDFSAEDCAKILVQANWRMTPPEEQKKQVKRLQPQKEAPPPAEDRGEFLENKSEIEEKLRSQGVKLPGDW